jgi:hypothetical protein
MLTSSNFTSLQASQTTTVVARTPQTTPVTVSHQLLQPPSSPVHSVSSLPYSSGVGASSSNTDQSGINGGGSAAALYKFKNNIKQRFTAEHHIEDNGRHHDEVATPTSDFTVNNCSVGIKRKRYSVESAHELMPGNHIVTQSSVADLKRRDSETCSIPSSPSSPPTSKYPPPTPSPDLVHTPPPPPPPPPPLRSLTNPSYGVPIFALHSKGSFYIPLTLDAEVLAPYLAAIGLGSDVNSSLQNGNTSSVSSSVVLHPVTISVNFQQINHHRIHQHSRQHIKHCSSIMSWKNELNGFLPMPKWSVYSPDRN